jgi:hypothetical protein
MLRGGWSRGERASVMAASPSPRHGCHHKKNFAPPGPLVSEADRWRDDAELERQQADALFDPVQDLSGRMDLLHRERQGVVEVRAQLP